VAPAKHPRIPVPGFDRFPNKLHRDDDSAWAESLSFMDLELNDLSAGCTIPYMNNVELDANIECVTRTGPDGGALIAVLEAAEQLEARLEEALGAVGLSISKFDALEQLMQCERPLTLGDLAGRLRCVRSNVTQLVDRLEADGLVKRGTCSEDRRAIRAKLTPLGQERHAAGVQAIRAVQQEIADRIDSAQRAELVRLMRIALG
jgi:DNA-binding MarR family transcriptional regulator